MNNPYTGPRPFERGDTLFGRDKEREALRALLIAERILVLHSPSGAGKTSLIQAGLAPVLQQSRFNVLPTIRVNSPLPSETQQANRYVLSVILSLQEELPDSLQRPSAELAKLSLVDYLTTRPKRKNASHSTVLLFDQFEEVLTVDPLNVEAKTEFFKQLGTVLENESFWALFALREDYLAALESYSALLPTHLANTFRLDLLQREAATQAIASPAAQHGKPFVATALNKLLDDLATQSIQQADGSFQQAVGQYIEPMQLQVVCYRLWQQLSDDATEINLSHLQHADNVNQALADYYASQVERIASNHYEQRRIREWFDEHLISPQGIRTQVLKEKEFSGSLANELIAGFVDAHLVRGEKRGGATWFELAHDRLIEPVRQSNEVWFDENLHSLQRQAAMWEKQGRPDSLLLRGKALKAAEQWVKQNAEMLLPVEQELLQRAQQQRRRERLRVTMVAGVVITSVLVAVGAMWLLGKAEQERQKAQTALSNAIRNQSYFLAEKAERLTQEGKVFTAMCMALEALPEESESYPKREFIQQAQQALYNAIDKHWRGVLEHDAVVNEAVFSPDGKQLLTLSGNNAYLWDVATRQLVATLQGHGGIVNSVSFSPDGAHIVTASDDHTARLWDVRTQQLLATLKGHKNRVLSVSFSPDGTRIVTASEDQTARLWNARGQMLATLQGHQKKVWSALFSPDGTRIVTASDDQTARLWDAYSGQLLTTLEGHEGWVLSASFSSNGEYIVTASLDKTARLWDAHSGQPLATLEGHKGWVWSALFSPDDMHIVTISEDQMVRLWDARSRQLFTTLQGHKGRVWSASFSPNGMQIITTSEDQTAQLWDVRSGQPLATLQGHKDRVWSASFSPDGARIATVSDDQTARLWDARGQPLTTLQGHTGWVMSASFNANGMRIVTASVDKTAQLWDVHNRQPLATLQGHTSWLRSASFSPDDTRIVTASDDQTARLWDAHDGQLLATLQGHEGSVNSVSFSPDGTRIVTASLDKTARLWDAYSGQALIMLAGHKGKVRSASFSPDGIRIVTASDDQTAQLWDAHNGQPLITLQGHIGWVRSASFSPDGTRIVTASDDQTARLWDAYTGQMLVTLQGHKKGVNSASFSPDGMHIVTASDDQTARLWNASSGQPFFTLQGHKSSINSALFSPDGTRIVTASNDKTVRLWLVFPNREALIAHAKKVLPRLRLTCEERERYFLDEVARCKKRIMKTVDDEL